MLCRESRIDRNSACKPWLKMATQWFIYIALPAESDIGLLSKIIFFHND
jgi:hypothetical protein